LRTVDKVDVHRYSIPLLPPASIPCLIVETEAVDSLPYYLFAVLFTVLFVIVAIVLYRRKNRLGLLAFYHCQATSIPGTSIQIYSKPMPLTIALLSLRIVIYYLKRLYRFVPDLEVITVVAKTQRSTSPKSIRIPR
jgi:hypothetical protein